MSYKQMYYSMHRTTLYKQTTVTTTTTVWMLDWTNIQYVLHLHCNEWKPNSSTWYYHIDADKTFWHMLSDFYVYSNTSYRNNSLS